MDYNSKHPCDICPHSDNCNINCVFYSYYSGYCSNYECIYQNDDIDCQFAKRCGSYISNKSDSELDFDDDIENDDDLEDEE